jgi:hypothetical protein
MIRTFREPVGNTDLPVYLTGRHGDAGHLTVGNDFLQAEWAVAENGDKSDKHGNLSVDEEYPVSSAHAEFMPALVPAVFRQTVLTGKSDFFGARMHNGGRIAPSAHRRRITPR